MVVAAPVADNDDEPSKAKKPKNADSKPRICGECRHPMKDGSHEQCKEARAKKKAAKEAAK